MKYNRIERNQTLIVRLRVVESSPSETVRLTVCVPAAKAWCGVLADDSLPSREYY